MAEIKLPPSKGEDPVPIPQLSDQQLGFWEKYLGDQLRDDPDGKWSSNNRLKLEAVQKERSARANGKSQASSTPAATKEALPERVKIPSELLMPIDDPKDFTARMAELDKYANLLTSATTLDILPPGCSLTLGKLDVSEDPSDGMVYKQKKDPSDGGPDRFSLGGGALKKLALMANIKYLDHKPEFLPGNPGYRDEHGKYPYGPPHPFFQRWTCRGTREELDGSVLDKTEEKTVDLRDGSPEASLQSDKQLARARVNIEQATKTKAKYRLIRVLLGLNDAYTQAQLAKPFIVVRLNRHGNYVTGNPEFDSQIKMLNYLRVHQANLLLFGKGPTEVIHEASRLLENQVKTAVPAQLPAASSKSVETFDRDGVSLQNPDGEDTDDQDDDPDENDDLPDFGDNDKV